MNANTPPMLATSECRVVFGVGAQGRESNPGQPALRVAMPVLAGSGAETVLADAPEPALRDGFTLYDRGALLAGFAEEAPGLDPESSAQDLYGRLFSVTSGLHLYRIWNYVPRINAVTDGMENYQRFCRGRSLAFEEKFGGEFQRALPSASAVGMAAGPLAVAFLAGRATPRHFENPRQTPAFKYPPKYGPRPPSFSRATAVKSGGESMVFISGTAAIRGHASVAERDFDGQLACTLENLELIGQAAGVGPGLGSAAEWRRSLKIFLRHKADLGPAQARLGRDLLRAGDAVSFIQADICRSDLLVEIEATLVSRT
jgi:enamine deaminase RidA (YjgF/YER057c/UK114 family)